jgi:hypothetical protein
MGRHSNQYYPGKTKMRTYRGGFGDHEIYQGCSGDWSDVRPIERCKKCKRLLHSRNSGLCNICGTNIIRLKMGILEPQEINKFREYIADGRKEWMVSRVKQHKKS